MNTPSPLEAIFFAALEKGTPQERAAYLDEACAGDPDLRVRAEKMLAAQGRADDFLEQPALPSPSLGEGVEGSATLDERLPERPGTMIGPYKLLEQIGEGGFGVVYMAEQTEPVRRKVALKILKAGMDTRQVVARFEAERQALAIMDHPNIAKVFDGGMTEPILDCRLQNTDLKSDISNLKSAISGGRPYFVMELVKGVPITEFCDQHHLTPRQRLELFIPVCHAVQHAHQKGIIHRDLKPSNILVVMHDTTPVPKVIDFGIAKALGQELTDKTLFTGFAQMVGTPLYMSPEQAGHSGLDIDTRSDIYSLGVLLYELLTGTTPFDKNRFKQAAYDEIRRIIREEEPPKPSTRLSHLSSPHAPREEPGHVTRSVTATLAAVAAQRQTEPAKLTKLVRGDLDWIVMKALEKDRNRRYETANGFAMDVQRYLADEAVLACPPSAAYRFRKFVRRNKGAFAAASSVVVVVVLALVGLTVSNVIITQEKNLKAEALQRAKTNEELAIENLEHALTAIDQMLLRVGHESLAHLPRMSAVRRELVEDALQLYQRLLEKRPEHRPTRYGLAKAYVRLAKLLGPAEAEVHFRKGFALFEALAVEEPPNEGRRRMLIWARGEFAQALLKLGKKADADEQMRAAVRGGEQLVGEFPGVDNTIALAAANRVLAETIASTQPEEAEKLLRRNLTIPSSAFVQARSYHDLGKLAWKKGLYAEAEQAFRKAVEFQDKVVPKRANERGMRQYLFASLNKLAESLVKNGNLQEAEEVYCRLAFMWDKLVVEEPAIEETRIGQAHAHRTHASILGKLSRPKEAEHAKGKSLEALITLAAEFPMVAKHQQAAFDECLKQGRLLFHQGRVSEAQETYTRAEIFAVRLDGDPVHGDPAARFKRWHELTQAHIDVARRWCLTTGPKEAEPALTKTIAMVNKLEADHSQEKERRYHLGESHVASSGILNFANRFEDTEKLARRGLAHAKVALAHVDDESARRLNADGHHLLGVSLMRLHRPTEAAVEFRLAVPIYEQLINQFGQVARYRPALAQVHNHLGWVLRHGKDPQLAEAEAEHRRALALFAQLADEFPEDAGHQSGRAELLKTVGVLRRQRGDLAEAKSMLEQAIPYAEKACELAPDQQLLSDRLEQCRRELATTLKAQEPDKKKMPN